MPRSVYVRVVSFRFIISMVMEQPLNICPQITYAIQLLSTGDNQDKAIGIIESVISDYDTKQYPNFSTGLAGIGAGIQYICNTQAELLQNRMIENMYYKENASCISANKNLDDLTILIPVRIDSTQRLENLYTMIEFYTSRTNARFILLEAGETQLVNITHYNHVEYIFCKDNNRIFHHTHYRNEMIKRAGTPIVAIWDIDIVVPLDQLYVAAEAIRKYGNVLSYPFDGCCYSIPEELSSKYRENPDIRLLENKHPVLSTMFGMLTVGGVFLANRKQYMRAGISSMASPQRKLLFCKSGTKLKSKKRVDQNLPDEQS